MPDIHDTLDDGFHEIQLSGKQLVFLFMATTIIAVVIFLCGVQVGRNVRGSDRAGGEPSDTLASQTAAPPAASTPTAAAPQAGPAAVEPPPAPPQDDELSYANRLQRADPAAGDKVQPAPAATDKREERKAPEPSGWVAQIGAYNERGAADNVSNMLRRNNFPAFVLPPTPGSPTKTFRVRVGPFATRGEADAIAARLKREHQFTPFVTR